VQEKEAVHDEFDKLKAMFQDMMRKQEEIQQIQKGIDD